MSAAEPGKTDLFDAPEDAAKLIKQPSDAKSGLQTNGDVLEARQVLVIEHEDGRSDALRARLPEWMAVVEWDALAILQDEIDWPILYAKKCILWPTEDEDATGFSRKIALALAENAERLEIVDIDRRPPRADENLMEWLMKDIKPFDYSIGDGSESEVAPVQSRQTNDQTGVIGVGSGEGSLKSEEEIQLPQFEPLAAIEPHPLIEFPVDAMGGMGVFVAALAEHTQTPPDLAGVCVLGFMAGAVSRKYQVDAGWIEEVALYFACVAPPGSRKSEVWKQASKPIVDHEMDLHASTNEEVTRNRQRLKLLEKRCGKIEAEYAKSESDQEREDAEREAMKVQREIAEVNAGLLNPPRLVVADITPEKLASLVEQNQERMILASAEGGQIFDRMFRYSQHGEPNMDLMLSGHTGDRCSIDRQNAESIFLRRPVLTVVATVQPHVLDQLARNRSFEGRGLLARFAYSIPRDVRGYRDVRSGVPMDEDAARIYKKTLGRMIEIPHDPEQPRILRVEGQALSDFHDFAQWVENAQRDDGEFEDFRGWASKAAGLVLRIAGVLAIADQPRYPDITPEVMARAMRLGLYFSEHSKRAFEIMQGLSGDPRVDKIWRWVRNRSEAAGDDFTRQELWQGVGGGRIRLASDMNAPLDRLVEAGRIARRHIPNRGQTRVPQVWAVNPKAL